MRLKDKVAIVTGAGSGFGEGIAKRFAQEGAKVLVNDINVDGGKRVAAEIKGEFVQGDVTKSTDWARLVETRMTWASASCSAWLSRSAAAISGAASRSMTTISSDGPAGMSTAGPFGRAAACFLASAT